MKNLKNFNIEDLEVLPKRMSSHKCVEGYDTYYYHYERGIWEIAERIIKNNIGKSFDLAFHYFCKYINYQQQYYHYFLNKFDVEKRYLWNDYTTDENRNVILTDRHKKFLEKKRNKKVKFESYDYTTQLVHKQTKHLFSNFKHISDNILIYQGKDVYHGIPAYKKYIAKKEDFILEIISGFSIEFNSKNDYKYKRLYWEHRKYQNKKQRELKKSLKEKQYNFLTKSELEIQKQKEIDHIKLLKHGFDENSFRFDPYHGKKKNK